MAEPEPVPLLDLKRYDEELASKVRAAFDRVFTSGCFILGPEVRAFEEECARYCGVDHAVGVSSGTDALLVALMALEVGPGDEVICPTFTFFASAGSIWRTGARPVFADIDPVTFLIDPRDVERKISPRTRAVMPVHLYGQSADVGAIREVIGSRRIAVIEDAAQAIGAEDHGRRAGAMGTVGCFSFFPTKNLGGFGDGGLVTTDDADLAERVRRLRVHGMHPKYHHPEVGGNFRLDALQAAILRVQLQRLDEATARRQANAALYDRLLVEAGAAAPTSSTVFDRSPIVLPIARASRHTYNQYVVRVRGEGARDRLRAHLTSRRIGTEIYYPVPLHLQECFSSLGHREGDFPAAEEAAHQALALPIFPALREEEIRRVVAAIAAGVRPAS